MGAWTEGQIVTMNSFYKGFVHEADSRTQIFIITNCVCVVLMKLCMCINEIYFSYQYLICYFQIKHMVLNERVVDMEVTQRRIKIAMWVLVVLCVAAYSLNGYLQESFINRFFMGSGNNKGSE
jgi:hypothetical protein